MSGSASSSGSGPASVVAFHQFHHDRALFHAVDRRDVGMVERRQHLCFPREAGEAVGIVGEDSGRTLMATSRPSLVSVAR